MEFEEDMRGFIIRSLNQDEDERTATPQNYNQKVPYPTNAKSNLFAKRKLNSIDALENINRRGYFD